MFCFVGVRSHFGSKQLWSMVWFLLVTFEQREMWRKVHYYYCFFWVKEVLLFCVFIECIFVGRYCIGPNLTMGITWTWGMAKTKPYFHGDILVVHVFFNIYLSFFLFEIFYWNLFLNVLKCVV
jgi:hypothetical protein